MSRYPKSLIIFSLIFAVCFALLSCGGKGAEVSAPVSKVEDGSDLGVAGADAKPPAEDSENPEDELPENSGGTEITRALIERAASMQDYSHAPSEDAEPIATVDDNILLLVNKTHPLASSYVPDDMVTIERTIEGVGNAETRQLRKVAADAMNALIDGAADAGYAVKVRTAYRSYDYQKSLYEGYAARHGEEEANKWSAKPGESEHQTGMCADVSSPSVDYGLTAAYGETAEGKWLANHAHEYGYIIRYLKGKEDITGYIYEPWHIRYVGVDAATEIYERGICLEEYLGVLD